MAKAKTLPKVSVVERRLANPFGAPSVEITLKTAGRWAIRIVNSAIRSGRYYDVVHNKGWVPVEPGELDGRPEEYGLKELDGRLVRGDRGEEVLMKMPEADYEAIQRAKAEHNLKGLGKKQVLESAASMAASQGMGDQAAETIYRSNMEITDSRVAMDLEGESVS